MNSGSEIATARLPAGACDSHLHFYDSGFMASPAALLHPPDATADAYRSIQSELGIDRLVIVQPTTYGLDNSCQLMALAAFGDAARAVVVIDDTVSATELRRLTDLGVRGARFHMLAGGAVPWDMLDEVARRIEPFGWHIQLQMNGCHLHERIDRLRRLPVDIVIDHIGRFMPPVGTRHRSFRLLVDFLESGKGWVKLSAPYESSTSGPPDYDDLQPLVETLVARVPERLLWATNWPHPGQADPPSPPDLVRLLHGWLGDTDVRRQILVDNPAELYEF